MNKIKHKKLKELIDFFDYKHENEGYSYNKLQTIAHRMFLKHKNIESEKEIYKLLEKNMKEKSMNELTSNNDNKKSKEIRDGITFEPE